MHSGKVKTIEFTTDDPGGTPTWTDIPELAEEGNVFPAIENSPVGLLDGAKTSGSALLSGSIRSLDVLDAVVALIQTAHTTGDRCFFRYTSFDATVVAIIGVNPLGCLLEAADVMAFTGAKSVFVVTFSAGGADEGDVQANTFS